MDLFEAKTQVFILRFWFEPREIAGANQQWRGMIEHVPTGERRYFQRIEEIPGLILPYLKELDVSLARRKPVWLWLQQFVTPIIKKNKS